MSDSESFEPLNPDLSHLVNDPDVKWVFVGGKGGVGKTTTSCSLALRLAKTRPADQKVLLISTDPAHNLSDAFTQKFSDSPTQVNNVPNLFAMETDPSAVLDKASADANVPGMQDAGNPLANLKDLTKSLPGIDEAIAFSQLLKTVRGMDFSVVVFDTAPTGHTLRLLSLPETLEKGISSLMNMGPMAGALKSLSGMMGPDAPDPTVEMQKMKAYVAEVRDIFRDPTQTTFVAVCIPEFLSVYETERLVQELAKYEIDCSNIVVNQVLYPAPGGGCNLCEARAAMQGKYLGQIDELYEDFHVVKMPLLKQEVRGVPAIESFSQNLVKAFVPPQ